MDNDFLIPIFKWLENVHEELPRMYLLGGVVRDWLLGKPTKDIDMVCRNAEKWSQTIARANQAIVVPFKKKKDIPCFRIINRNGSGMVLDISEMRGDTIEQDLGCRDFCMNAIAVEIIAPDGKMVLDGERVLIDPMDGQRDLKNRQIRMCSEHAFGDDPLRMIRAIRFCAELGFFIEKYTYDSICRKAACLRQSAPERIMGELIRIFNVSHCTPYIRQMDQLGLLEVIIPEVQPMKGCSQNLYHHQDVWEHSLRVLGQLEAILDGIDQYLGDQGFRVLHCLEKNDRRAFLKMAALLHDVAKPVTCQKNPESGAITFYGHDKRGKEIVSGIGMRLKLSGKHRLLLEQLAGEHIHVVHLSRPEVKKSTIVRFFRKWGDDAVLSILLSMADVLSKEGILATTSYKKTYLDWCRKILEEYFRTIRKYLAAKNLIDGNDLMKMGVAPGPGMGKILQKVRSATDSERIQNRQDALNFAKSLIQNGPGANLETKD